MTTPERTAIDLGRTHGLLAGVVPADAALRRGGTIERLRAAAERVRGMPGSLVATRVADLATWDDALHQPEVLRARADEG